MSRYRGPGPGEVRQFAEEIKQLWHGDQSQWAKGVRYAVAWVMDEGEIHPIIRKRSRELPNMKEIVKTAQQTESDTINDPQFNADYYTGVKDCLEWITGDNDSRPQVYTHPS